MKNLKSLLALSMTALFLSVNASAAPESAKQSKETQVVKKEVVAEPRTVSQAISIEAQDRQLTIDSTGQALAVFKYVITNVSNKPISAIQWVSVYVHNREVAHSQDMQIDLQSLLAPGKSLTINLQIPFLQIQEKFRPVFMDSQSKIDVYPVDRVIRFNDQKELRERK